MRSLWFFYSYWQLNCCYEWWQLTFEPFNWERLWYVKNLVEAQRCLTLRCTDAKTVGNEHSTMFLEIHLRDKVAHWMVSQVEVQTQICFWSDFPDRNYLWSEFPDGNSLWSDFPNPSDLWSDFPDTEGLWPDFSDRRCSDQTIFRPWSRVTFRPLPRP